MHRLSRSSSELSWSLAPIVRSTSPLTAGDHTMSTKRSIGSERTSTVAATSMRTAGYRMRRSGRSISSQYGMICPRRTTSCLPGAIGGSVASRNLDGRTQSKCLHIQEPSLRVAGTPSTETMSPSTTMPQLGPGGKMEEMLGLYNKNSNSRDSSIGYPAGRGEMTHGLFDMRSACSNSR